MRDTADRLKLHRRLMRVDGRDYNVVSLRSGARARFSTNRCHETWHILSDVYGARLLGRLLWGLSFQRRTGTLVVIDVPHLDTNPFDAEASDPIALVPSHLTVMPKQAARSLRHRLATPSKPDGTVRWHTWGLDPRCTLEAAKLYPGVDGYDPLFPTGYGLRYGQSGLRGAVLKATWNGTGPGQIYMQNPAGGTDLRGYLNAEAALVFYTVVHQPPAARTLISAHCVYPCFAEVVATPLFQRLPVGTKATRSRSRASRWWEWTPPTTRRFAGDRRRRPCELRARGGRDRAGSGSP
jgi:hypothetical protein